MPDHPLPPTPPTPPGGRSPLLPDRPVPGAASSKPIAVQRDDLHPKIRAGMKTYAGILLAGIIAAVGAAQQNLSLSPAATLAVTALGGVLPLVAGYFKAGDGR